MKKDLLKLLDLSSEEILEILDTADQLKAMRKA
ncbi:MAG: ornithine carbamoyltransferase, partial [Candidatus Enterenecus sp.]